MSSTRPMALPSIIDAIRIVHRLVTCQGLPHVEANVGHLQTPYNWPLRSEDIGRGYCHESVPWRCFCGAWSEDLEKNWRRRKIRVTLGLDCFMTTRFYSFFLSLQHQQLP